MLSASLLPTAFCHKTARAEAWGQDFDFPVPENPTIIQYVLLVLDSPHT